MDDHICVWLSEKFSTTRIPSNSVIVLSEKLLHVYLYKKKSRLFDALKGALSISEVKFVGLSDEHTSQ